MSEIQKALAAATEVEPSKRKNETETSQEYMKRLAVAVGELSDDEWAKLSGPQQDWYNAAADALRLGNDIPVYGDVDPPATGRRRAATEPAAKPWAPAVGDTVDITTKRGKDYVGVKIVELDDTGLVLDNDVELDHDKIDRITPVGGAAAASAEPEGPVEPEVGDTVEVTTARGKVIVGNVEELEGDDLLVKDATGDVHELTVSKLKSFKVKVKNAGRGRAATTTKAEVKETPAAGEKKKITAKDNAGVSATMRMRELICADPDAKKDAVEAALKKEGLEFKTATLDLIYSDTQKIIGILRNLKKLKA